MLVFALLTVACGSAAVTATSEGTDAPAEATGLTISLESDFTSGFPPFEDFEVELAPTMLLEEVTAVGEMDDGLTLLGSNCEDLLAEYPELADCFEETNTFRGAGEGVDVGRLDADGILTIPSPDADSRLRVTGPYRDDDLCSLTGSVDVAAGQTEVVVQIGLECA